MEARWSTISGISAGSTDGKGINTDGWLIAPGDIILYSDLQQSDLFQFFNMSVTGEVERNDLTVVHAKPGGFQEFIDIEFLKDANENIVGAVLLLDRSWIGDIKSINMFSKDMAKSFLAGIAPSDGFGILDDVVKRLWHLQGMEDTVIYAEQPDLSGEASLQARSVVEVFLGLSPSFLWEYEGAVLNFENVEDDGRERFRIEIDLQEVRG